MFIEHPRREKIVAPLGAKCIGGGHSKNSKTYFSSNAMSNFVNNVRYSFWNDRRP
jgi:hypothetical protein